MPKQILFDVESTQQYSNQNLYCKKILHFIFSPIFGLNNNLLFFGTFNNNHFFEFQAPNVVDLLQRVHKIMHNNVLSQR
jgi:hypothetical protein